MSEPATEPARDATQGAAGARRRMRPARRLVWITAALLVVLAGLTGALRFGPMTDAGRSFIEGAVGGAQAGRLGTLGIEGLTGDIWSDFKVARLTLADRQGVWLDARDISLRWDAADLLERRLHIRKMSARVITLTRRPQLGPEGKPGRSVVSLAIDDASARLELAPAMAQVRGLYDLRVSLHQAIGGAARGRINAISALRAGDHVALAFDLDGRGGFNVYADALEAQGGAVAGAAGLDAAQPFSLAVSAVGDARAGRFDVRSTNGAISPVSAHGDWGGAGGSASGQVMLTASSLLHDYARIAGPAARFQIDGKQAGDGLYALSLAVRTDNILIDARGSADIGRRLIGPGGVALDVHVHDPSRVTTYPKMGPARVWGVLSGGSARWRFAGADSIDNPADNAFSLARVSGPLKIDARGADITIEAGLTGEGGSGQGLAADLLGAAPRASASLERLADGRLLVRRLDIAGAGLSVSASGDVGLFGELGFKGAATITRLAAARAGSNGSFKADWSAGQSAPGRPWSFTLDGEGSGLTTGAGEAIDHLLGRAPRLSAAGDYQDGVVRLTHATLDGAAGSVSGSGQIGPAGALELALAWTAHGPLGIGPLEVDGDLKGTGDVAGTIEAPRLEATAAMASLALPGLPLSQAQMAISIARSADGADGRATLTGASPYGPARAGAAFVLAASGLTLSGIDLNAGGVSASGAAAVRNGEPASADLTVAIGPGALLAEGSATGRLKIIDAAGGARASLQLTAADAVPPQGGMAVKALRLEANGPLQRLPFSLTADGVFRGGAWRLKGDGSTSDGAGQRTVSFNGAGRAGRVDVRTLNAALIEFGGGRTHARARLAIGAGQADVDVDAGAGGVDAKASVSNLNLDLFSQDYEGKFNANLALSGRGANLTGLLDARLAGAGGRDLKGAPPVDGEIKARLGGGLLAIDAALDNSQGLKATSNLTLPAEASAAPFRIAINTQRPLAGRFAVDGEIKPIWDLLMGGDRSLAGHLVASGTLAGDLADPRAVGTAVLDGGSFHDALTGLKLASVNLRATMANNAIDFSQFSASDPAHGQISGGGTISLARDGVSSLRLSLKRFRLLDNDLTQAAASGDVNVNRGADGHVRLTGDLTIDRALISPTSPVASGVVPMDVVEIHQPLEFDSRFQSPARGAAPVSLDMRLRAPGGIFVKGRGLDLELSLDARVQGSTVSPLLSGAAHVVRGDYNFAGQRFQIDDRGVVYLGSSLQSVRLDLTATREDPTLTAVIKIGGTAAKPTITLTSTPVLPRDEVLSQVLFGASASQLSPLQAAQLASAVSGLASGGGFDVIGGLRNFAHLDRLAISDTETTAATVVGGRYVPAGTETTVSGGKYLSDNVYLELTGGAREGTGAQVEWRIRKHVSLVSKVTSQGDSLVSVRWRHDY